MNQSGKIRIIYSHAATARSQAVNRRVTGSLFDADARYQHHGQHEPEHHPTHTANSFAAKENFDKKEAQAAHQQHDQHRD